MLNKSGAKSYQMDMCTGSILKKMLIFSLPLMASSMLQLLFNAADIIVVARFAGDNALAAVGSNTALINLLTNFFMGLSIGANVLVARYFGAKNDKDLSETVHTAMMLSIYSGIILTIIGVLCAKQILIWMQTPEAVLGLATVYLRIYFLGMTATMIYNFGSAILRAVGDTKRPLYYLFAAGIVNVILNLIFVYALEYGIIKENPVPFVKNAVYLKGCERTKAKAENKILSKEEIDLVTKTVRSRMTQNRYHGYFILGYAILLSVETGMRVGELCALKWDDVKEDGIHIHAQQLMYKENGRNYYYVDWTKDEKGFSQGGRRFPITIEIRNLLSEIKSVQDSLGIESEYVFCNREGR